MPIIEYPDGTREDLGANPPPAAIEAARMKFTKMQAASGGMLTPGGVQQTAAASGQPILTGREMAQGATGLVAALPAVVTGNLPLAAVNFLSGAGAAGEAIDAFTGKADIRRAVVTGGATALAMAAPFTKALTFGKQVLTGALASGVAGQLYDLASGGSATPTEATSGAARDLLGGGLQAALMQTGREQTEARQQKTAQRRDLRTPEERARLTRISEQENIPLSAADITGSRTAARIEQYPSRSLFGSDQAYNFRVKQVEAAEASVARHLDRIDQASADIGTRNPTAVGLRLKTEFRGLVRRFRQASDQAYQAEAEVLGKGAKVTPGRLAQEAQSVLDEYAASGSGVPPTAVVGYDPLGKPITLQELAGNTKPIPWVKARQMATEFGERGFASDRPIGTVTEGIRKRLWGAMREDMGQTLNANPAAAEFSKWVDTGYGAMKENINERLRHLIAKPAAKDVLPRLFEPGDVENTAMLREVLPRDVFDYASASWLRNLYDNAHTDVGAGRRQFSPQQFVNKLKKIDQSGQLDVMFDSDTSTYLRDLRDLTPAFQAAEKIAGNPSGTAQAINTEQQARETVKQGVRMLTGPLSAITGGATSGGYAGSAVSPFFGEYAGPIGATLGGAAGLASTVALPRAVGSAVYSPAGSQALASYLTGPNPDSTMRTLFRHYLTAIPAQGLAATAVPQEPKR